jgi:cytochrome c-type biogenesis protein CcmH
VFYLFPRGNRTPGLEDTSSANLAWYRLRRDELLAEGGEDLQGDIELRLLEDDAQAEADTAGPVGVQSFPRWALLPIISLAAAALYYQLGAAPDVLIGKQLKDITETSPPEQMQALLQAIEKRSAQRPDNLHYTALLGRFYMGQQDYNRAAKLYGGLALAAPGDAQALAYAAQAEYLAANRVLDSRAQMFAEQALAIDPHQRTALGLLGMASFEQQQYRAAIEYWQRLLAMEAEGSEGANMIASVIERAREKLGDAGEDVASSAEAIQSETGVATVGVSVRVAFPGGADIAPDDTVFVLARGANSSSRMPVAVQRLQASQLPITIRLDDSKSMAGQKLSAMESIVVVVQVSPEGRPGEANASWLGRAGPLAPSLDMEPLEIELMPR